MPNGVQLLGGVLRGRHLKEQLSDVSVVGQAGVVTEDAAVFWKKRRILIIKKFKNFKRQFSTTSISHAKEVFNLQQ